MRIHQRKSVGLFFSWLLESLVLDHVASERSQDLLHGRFSFPRVKQMEVLVHHARVLVNAGKIYTIDKADGGWLVRVVHATVDLHGDDPVLQLRVLRAQDHGVPLGEGAIARVLQPQRHRRVVRGLLSALQLLVQAESTGH